MTFLKIAKKVGYTRAMIGAIVPWAILYDCILPEGPQVISWFLVVGQIFCLICQLTLLRKG